MVKKKLLNNAMDFEFKLQYLLQISKETMRNMRYMLIVILMILCQQIIGRQKPTQYLPQGLWPFKIGQFSQSGNMIMAYYDFNKDRHLDILTRSTIGSQPKLNLYIWREKWKKFTLEAFVTMIFDDIVAVLPSDYNNDGYDDIAIVFNQGITQDSLPHYAMQIMTLQCYWVCKFADGPRIQSQYMIFDQINPFVMTINNEPTIIISQLHTLYALKWDGTILKATSFETNFITRGIPDASDENKTLPSIISGQLKTAYWGDYDGDCLSDLILLLARGNKNYLQFFQGYQNSNSKLVFVYQIATQYIVHHFNLQDVNFDGKQDLIVLFAQNVGIQIHYHKFGKQTNLCTKVPFPFDMELPSDPRSIGRIQRIPFQEGINTFRNSLLRFGDLDNDGYPDLSLSLKIGGRIKSYLYKNTQCQASLCGTYNLIFVQKSTVMNLRTFVEYNFIGQNINSTKYENIESLTFFDVYEDGYIDIIANTYTIPTTLAQKTTYNIQAFYNNLSIDAFFMKIMLLDGRGTLANQNGVLVGGTVQMFVTLLSGYRAPTVGNQLTQLTSRVLELPYIHLGLGRTNNYAQTLTANIPYDNQLTKHWSPIVPNSQVVIIPPITNPKWLITTYIQATDKLGTVFWVVLMGLIILGAVILYQTRKEKLQDKQNMESFYSILR